jgi:beta-aspartyl-peptidase (threonine type)
MRPPLEHPDHPALAVHGGAGALATDEQAGDPGGGPRQVGVRRACEAGWAVLRAGGGALDAVVAAVVVLEDDPVFNAGVGGALTAAGEVELDASLMDGGTLGCGAVAAVRDVRNPILLARAVMERSPHVLLAGAGASSFAREVGIPAVPNTSLITPAQLARWQAARALAGAGGARHGTVGAVARDARGHLAAATSTGGMTLKRAGRVGDSPLIGCGTYADDALGAVSCTGHGERIIQLALARLVADRVGQGHSAQAAAEEGIRQLGARVHGEGGVIVLGPSGTPALVHNAAAMARAWVGADGAIRSAV